MTTTGAGTLRRAAALLDECAKAVEGEMGNPRNHYWGGAGSDHYRTGVRNGLGGAAGELTALFTPETARHLSAWLDREAALIDAQVFPQSDLAMERYPLVVACDLLGEVPA